MLVLPDDGYSERDAAQSAAQRPHEIAGTMRVDIRRVDSAGAHGAGKTPFVIHRPAVQRAAASRAQSRSRRMSLRWKLHRLAAMDGREIGHRVGQQAQATLERFGLFAAKVPHAPATRPGARGSIALPRQFDVDKYCAAADRIIAGEFDVFALRPAQLGFPPQWNRDPKTGRIAPLTFGKALNYRDERIVGDIKYLWEPSRHAELLTLAQAWHLSRDSVMRRLPHAAGFVVRAMSLRARRRTGPAASSTRCA